MVSITLFIPGMAQKKYAISVGTGLGSYSMDDLKEFQDANESNFQDLLKTVDDFPAYVYYRGEITRKFGNKFSAGATYRFESTGYKSSYSDYSGSISFQQTLQVQQAGIVMGYEILKRNKVSLSAQLRGYYSWTACDFEYRVALTGSPTVLLESVDFESNSTMINPAFNLAYAVLDRLSLHVTVGYCLDMRGELKLKNKPEYPLTLPDQSPVKSDWSGMRAGLAVSFSF
jgi:hypothetical protein